MDGETLELVCDIDVLGRKSQHQPLEVGEEAEIRRRGTDVIALDFNDAVSTSQRLLVDLTAL